jgi:hypothetical protein
VWLSGKNNRLNSATEIYNYRCTLLSASLINAQKDYLLDLSQDSRCTAEIRT